MLVASAVWAIAHHALVLGRIWANRSTNLRELKQPLRTMAALTRADRVLVVAPHSDDEILATGGLIAQAVRVGAAVHVVLTTNGDGHRYAAERLVEELEVTPRDYLEMAAERQRESLAGLASLGLEASHVTFLGYPDGGTARMWLQHWLPAHPYTSRTTGDSRNPYANSLRPGAPYAGRSLLEDLKTVIRRVKPTVIFCPHPNDNHPDHWAAYCYTLAALYELRAVVPPFDHVELRLYLVHRGDWPVPQGLHTQLAMSPPAALADLNTRWESLPLGPTMAERKRHAVGLHRTQMMVMRRFLLSFVRSSELFGALPTGRLAVVSPGTIRLDGDPSDWDGVQPVTVEPVQDQGPVDLAPAADITRAYVAWDGEHLFVRLDTLRRVSSAVKYQIHIHPLINGKVAPPRTFALRPGRRHRELEVRAAGRCLEVAIPWPARPGFEGLMIGAATRSRVYPLDRSAWAMVSRQ